MASAASGQWASAGAAFEHSMELAKGSGRRINYGFLADIFSKAGDPVKTDYYRRLALGQWDGPRYFRLLHFIVILFLICRNNLNT